MRSRGFSLVYAPGLPSWPRLYLDAGRKRAYLSERIVTWRSQERAYLTTKVITWTWNIVGTVWIWGQFPAWINPFVRVVMIFVVFALLITFSRRILDPALRGFLARQIFAERAKAWVSGEAIAFRSRLYQRGVVIWRHWKGHPVQGRFDLSEDPEVMSRRHASNRQWQDEIHFRSARILRLIISAGDPESASRLSNQANFYRCVPMFEIDIRQAQQFTVVLSAAAALTAGGSAAEQTPKSGHDSDTTE